MIRRIRSANCSWDAKLPSKSWHRNRVWSLSNLNALSKSRFVNNAISGVWAINSSATENWSQQF